MSGNSWEAETEGGMEGGSALQELKKAIWANILNQRLSRLTSEFYVLVNHMFHISTAPGFLIFPPAFSRIPEGYRTLAELWAKVPRPNRSVYYRKGHLHD